MHAMKKFLYFLNAALVIIFLFLTVLPVWKKPVYAETPTPNTQVGDIVTDPGTGEDSEVILLVKDDSGTTTIGVVTQADRRILTMTDVGDTYPASDENGDWTITSTTSNALGYVDQVTMERSYSDPDDPNNTIHETQILSVAEDVDTTIPPDKQGTQGTPESTINPPPPASGDSNYIYVMRKGACGGDGSDGFGIQICLFGWCVTLGKPAQDGKDGSTGPFVTINAPPSHGSIQTASSELSGITGVSIGGDGGQGGDFYGNKEAGHGGAAGNGGSVTITSDTTISTSGEKGHGIFGQSKAGRAGDGGAGYIWGQGGYSGEAAYGGTVEITNGSQGLIGTTGDYAYGIFAQSIGGAAGSGGGSWGIVGEGGSSRSGGNGGTARITHWGNIVTSGKASHGVFAQSVGGTGGDGGGGAGIVGLGGTGSVGGDGGDVNVSTKANSMIETHGEGSHGILAQSIGGGGGNGGIGAGITGLGASGASGGNGGSVTVNHGGSILTHADGSFGILAQSIGGGGGNAGVGAGLVAIGASGSEGGNGDTVTVNTYATGSIYTSGQYSHGILAQSIGGGGGTGGTGGGLVAIGGSGGKGGDGSSVSINNSNQSSANINTTGDYSRGIFAQSIGGGGGSGGPSGGAVSIGGSGEGGGSGGDVMANNGGEINTYGDYSDGFFVQSIGGGGGDGAGSGGAVSLGGSANEGGNGGDVTLINTGKISTRGNVSRGIFAQSIGGGGGSGAGSGGIVSLGGSGSGGGHGGVVSVTNTEKISTGVMGDTSKVGSVGIFAQSVGGGGGYGAGSGGGVSLGGDSGNAGNGDMVTISNSGDVTTWQPNSTAIFAQSVGGGGGYGIGGGGSGGIVSLGGTGGMGGNGSTVTVVNDGAMLQTAGKASKGIFAQSVGGGGGYGAASGGVISIGGSGSSGGSANDVSVINSGDINTRGLGAEGIFAQSVGGGGGDGAGSGGVVSIGGDASTGGSAGKVSVTSSGVLETGGNDSHGIFAQSVGGGGGNAGAAIGGLTVLGVSIGGEGGNGGSGNDVSVTIMPDVSGSSILTDGDRSNGILAQSIGGGGGNGGFSIAGSVGAIASLAVAIGGNAGNGGDANSAIVNASTSIETRGEDSDGLVAQSIGGGGGNGGLATSGAVQFSFGGGGAIAIGMGGSGGHGGSADSVVANLTGSITTSGEYSEGLLAQSIGGGGGNGGFDITAALSGGGAGSGAITVGLGGKGGDGGSGSTVKSVINGNISTSGKDADAVVLQSVGGGGGNGGYNISSSVSGAGVGSCAISVGVGGSGGSGGNGSEVNLDLTGDVNTQGDRSEAVLAQSVGGGGGNGGFDISFAGSGAATGSGAISVGVGGSGDTGGNGGKVTGSVRGDISTQGSDADAIIFQSVGGGGGNGGFNISGAISGAAGGSGVIPVGIGGAGAGGGSGNTVSANISGNISTVGNRSEGILLQTVGGGGGNGGFNISGGISGAGTGSGAVSVGVGGVSGSGGNGATLSASVTGSVITSGIKSSGIVAQSVGGGGGNGGLDVSGSVSTSGTGSGAISVGVGGVGGSGGAGDDVDLSFLGIVNTLGDESLGIIAQSVGGGGGSGGLSVSGDISASGSGTGAISVGIGGRGGQGGSSGNVDVDITGDIQSGEAITTSGTNSVGILVQSVAGGGGNGGLDVSGTVGVSFDGAAFSAAVGVGGFGGNGGSSGNVSVDVVGRVAAAGSDGVVAQSVGGGGGNGGINVSGNMDFSGSAGAYSAAFGLGGFGSGGGNAGSVNVDLTGDVFAFASDPGKSSNAVVAQSIGGGGGNGAINISGDITANNPTSGNTASLALGVGGFGSGGGNAADVSVTIDNNQTRASGDGGSAVVAQSLGGSGGNGGLNVSGGIVLDGPVMAGVGGFGGNGGNAGNVSVDVQGSVVTQGKNATGIMAQSIGGGGGNGAINVSGSLAVRKKGTLPSLTFGIGGFGGNGNASGNVSVDYEGSVTTQGDWSHGLLAQSIAGGGGNGAMNIAASAGYTGKPAPSKSSDMSIVVGIGGHGGAGADAGDVNISNTGNMTIQGEHSCGVLAQSIGGGGGNGGMNVSTVLNRLGSPIVVGVGGFGSGGGDAGKVIVSRGDQNNPAGTIVTAGNGSVGIEASSIGGGGGDAGFNFLVSLSAGGTSGSETTPSNPWNGKVNGSKIDNFKNAVAQIIGDGGAASNTYCAQVAIGGFGAHAGNGNSVLVENFSDINSYGEYSRGILAQSIGGGGGNATFNLGLGYASSARSAKVALGGVTGDGGEGGNVSVNHHGSITADGNDAAGIIAQSIGGGGGNAGFDFVYNKTTAAAFSLTLGRKGGTGGSGGDIDLSSAGSIVTTGENGYGLLAQSIGNGGGNSSVTSIKLTGGKGETGEKGGIVSVGLEGGHGGKGGKVSLNAAGSITTLGKKAHGIFAQSVGGGGGNGGNSNTASLNTPTVAVGVGGTGGQGGTGDMVTVNSQADVYTIGDEAVGILAQSIGGGGGTGGMAFGGGLKTSGSGVQVTVGGDGGDGNDGGEISVNNSGAVLTSGSRSYGIVAQSLGGGGGNGGIAINGLINTSSNSARVLLSVGGSGGTGGVGRSVMIRNTGSVGTFGEKGVGILAQSIGGGGGDGNTAITGTFSSPNAVTTLGLGIGGHAGDGGTGGDITVSNLVDNGVQNSGLIYTEGNGAHGIMALSVGGGGGTGGAVITATNSFKKGSKPHSDALSLNIGGKGGKGGAAGRVAVANEGRIVTNGEEAHGILAESIGGGGGNGGIAISGNVFIGGTEATGINSAISIGGTGGNGNVGNDVSVENDGAIETNGERSCGIFAQSVGGGGGNGNVAVAVSIDPTIVTELVSQSTLFSIAVGGSGGDGGNGGNVTVNNNGDITVSGKDSYGIFAQSAGGGGGTSSIGYSSPFWTAADLMYTVVLGGKSASEGKCGIVAVNTDNGTITTSGFNNKAVFSQSVNGGGGDLNMYLDISKDAADLYQDIVHIDEVRSVTGSVTASFKGIFCLGSEDTHDSGGGSVNSSYSGSIVTGGDSSPGIFGQSVGGGGGDGTVRLIARNQADLVLKLNLGAKNGNDNPGGDVDIQRSGSISTSGKNSNCVSVQSIGGGGGLLSVSVSRKNSGGSIGQHGTGNVSVEVGSIGGVRLDGGSVSLNMTGDLSTDEDPSMGIMAQSIGAGGGVLFLAGGSHVDVLLGGQKGTSGNGGDIDISNTGNISTNGSLSHGIFVQSIGGGGGAIFTGLEPSSVSLTLSPDGTGNGGNVSVNQGGNINTAGESSPGVLLQSIGGGGGVVDDIFAGSAGGIGNAGNINLSIAGNVSTAGNSSSGICAQSNAGSDSSGNLGLNISGNVQTSGEDSPGFDIESIGGEGAGKIDVVQNGDVTTTGDHSEGIKATCSAGTGSGGGIKLSVTGNVYTYGKHSDGIRILNEGSGAAANSNIDINVVGSVAATGTGSSGIYASNTYSRANCDINIELNGDLVAGGTGSAGTGVSMIGGINNTLTNNSILTTVEGIGGLALFCTTGNDLVTNNAQIIGNVDLGPGNNLMTNSLQASIFSGNTFNLSSSGLLVNSGIISPGGKSVVLETRMTGDFIQTSQGIYEVSLDFNSNSSDKITETGSARMGGTVALETLNPARLMPGEHRVTIMSATGGITNDDLELDVTPSAVVSYFLRQPSAYDLAVDYDIDFSPKGLSKNQGIIGEYFNDVQLAGGSPAMDPYIIQLFDLADVNALAQVYEPLIPDFYDHFTKITIKLVDQSMELVSGRMRNLQRVGKMFSSLVPVKTMFSNGEPVMLAYNGSNEKMLELFNMPETGQKYGVWMDVSGVTADRGAEEDFTGYGFDSLGISSGFDTMLNDNVVAGISLSVSKTNVDVDHGEGSGDIKNFFASIYGGFFTDDFYLNGSVSYGRHEYHSSRYLDVFSVPTHTTSKHHGDSFSFYGESGYTLRISDWMFQPYAGLEFAYLDESSFKEKGAGAMSVIIKDRYTKSLETDVGARLSKNFKVGSGTFTPEISAAWNHDYHIDDRSLNSTFAGFPDASFSIETPEQSSEGLKVSAGLSFSGPPGVSTHVRCNGEWRNGYRSVGVIGELCIRF